MKLAPYLCLTALLSGCSLINTTPAGLVTGVVLFNGEPAAGKRVALIGTEQRAYTDANGRYSFARVPAGQRLRVSYTSLADRPQVTPNEVAEWQSAPFALEGGGKEVPPFDVAYNGLLYPDVRMSLIVNAESLVPLHWSTHPQAQRYRVRITDKTGFDWASEWAGEPTALFAQAVNPGTYTWKVEIDGGDAGTGVTQGREVDF